jgi:hypothetical protein
MAPSGVASPLSQLGCGSEEESGAGVTVDRTGSFELVFSLAIVL